MDGKHGLINFYWLVDNKKKREYTFFIFIFLFNSYVIVEWLIQLDDFDTSIVECDSYNKIEFCMYNAIYLKIFYSYLCDLV